QARGGAEDGGVAAAAAAAIRGRSHAELARLHFRAGRRDAALRCAARCLREGAGSPPEARAVAATYLALVLGQQGRWREARLAALRRRREASSAPPAGGDPALEAVLEQMASGLFEGAERAVEGADLEGESPLHPMGLFELGLVEEALELLDALDLAAAGELERGRLLGDRAQILAGVGRWRESLPLFLEAESRFRAFGEDRAALEAARQAARCEMQLGEAPSAEKRLRALWVDRPEGPERAALLRSLAAAVQARARASSSPGPQGAREAALESAALLEEAAKMPGIGEEDSGLGWLNLGLVRLRLLADPAGAEEAFRRALPRLESARSEHAEPCRRALESLGSADLTNP
ncbi:MAG: hypothetical protein AAF725_16335, partial [Acidobacteriota bacterium]